MLKELSSPINVPLTSITIMCIMNDLPLDGVMNMMVVVVVMVVMTMTIRLQQPSWLLYIHGHQHCLLVCCLKFQSHQLPCHALFTITESERQKRLSKRVHYHFGLLHVEWKEDGVIRVIRLFIFCVFEGVYINVIKKLAKN